MVFVSHRRWTVNQRQYLLLVYFALCKRLQIRQGMQKLLDRGQNDHGVERGLKVPLVWRGMVPCYNLMDVGGTSAESCTIVDG